MIQERIPISGDLKNRVRQLMEYAGWCWGTDDFFSSLVSDICRHDDGLF